MFSHIVLGSNNTEKSKAFYDAIFGALGAGAGTEIAPDRLLYTHNGGSLMVVKPLDGKPATFGNGSTIGFAMSSPEALFAWHAAGVANGGTSCEDAPGLREAFGAYLAYLRDPDGNKLCAVHRLPQ